MKKMILFFIYILCNIFIMSAELVGTVRVENIESFGVFVYIEETNQYDITDELGNFKITDLNQGKEYTFVFQKENMGDIKKNVKIDKEIQYESFFLKKEQEKKKYKMQLLLSTPINKEGYLKIKKFPYGILLQPNKYTISELEVGKYEGEIIQEGAFSKNINFEIKEIDINNIGIISLKAKEGNSLRLIFQDEIDDGYFFLYKDDELKHIERFNNKRKNYTIKNLEQGDYTLQVKAYGKKDYEKNIKIKGQEKIDIKLSKLSETNVLYLNLYPEDMQVDIKLFDENGILIKEEKNKKGLCTFSNLDWEKKYNILIKSKGYKDLEMKGLKVGEKIDAALAKDIKGVRITGTIYPFNSLAEVMILDNEKILAKTICDENGNYEIDADENIIDGRKILKIRAKNFKEYKEYRTVYKGQEIKNVNIEIEPLKTSLYGRVTLKDNIYDFENVVVIIEELGMWQYANKNGRYYFADIPWGVYNISYKKLGYKEQKLKSFISDKEIKEINVELIPQSYLFVKSNVSDYEININGKKENVNKKSYEKILSPGTYKINFLKKDYINIEENVILYEAGEIREINLIMKKMSEYKNEMEEKIKELKILIDKGEIKEAEFKIKIILQDKNSYIFKNEIDALILQIKNIKDNLFDVDRYVREKLTFLKKEIENIEKEDLSYGKKRKKLDNKYKESIEYLEKVLKEKKYTQLKYEVYNFIGDIYIKMGMENSAKENYEKAKKYKD